MHYKNSLKQIILPIVLASVLVAGFFIGKIFTPGTAGDASSRLFIYPQTNKIEALLNLIEDEYVDSIRKSDLIEKIIPEILKNLDPHTVYIPADELKSANQELEGNFGGIGVQFSVQNDTVLVVSVISGGPSEKVGIIPGDRIISANDSLLSGVNVTMENVVNVLRGEMGTKVKVGILRSGRKELIDFDIIRGSIPVYSVDVSYMVTDSIGYIKVSRFGRNTYHEFLAAMAKLKAANCKSVIIDFRGNAGGYLDVAIRMTNEFLAKGDLIVYTEGNSNPRQNEFANGAGSCQNVGLTVLIDEFSASASEIFAGAIQDNDRGIIIGRRSFGKGLVQQQIPLPDGSAIRLTVARYYTPSGRCIQKPYENGVEDYHRDILARFEHGEFFERDSISMNDSLQYTTRTGRLVYGGGGVMPDVFVARDTTAFSEYYFQLREKLVIYKFALKYSDDNRLQLQRFDTVDTLLQHLEKQPLTTELIKTATAAGIRYNAAQFRRSQQLIEIELKAYIARNIFDNDGFYPIFHEIDEVVKTAIREIREGNDIIITN